MLYRRMKIDGCDIAASLPLLLLFSVLPFRFISALSATSYLPFFFSSISLLLLESRFFFTPISLEI